MAGPDLAETLVLITVAALLVCAAVTDLRAFRIPDGIPIALVGLFLVWLPVHGMLPGQVAAALLTGCAVFLVGLGLFACNALGGGDVKLISVLALWAGPSGLGTFATTTALAGGALALAWLGAATLRRAASSPDASEAGALLGRPVPYAVAIAAGGLDLVIRHLAA